MSELRIPTADGTSICCTAASYKCRHWCTRNGLQARELALSQPSSGTGAAALARFIDADYEFCYLVTARKRCSTATSAERLCIPDQVWSSAKKSRHQANGTRSNAASMLMILQ